MLTKLLEDRPYKGREATGSIPINLSFEQETAALVNDLAPTKKSKSAYLARLLHAEVARKEERARMRRLLSENDEVYADTSNIRLQEPTHMREHGGRLLHKPQTQRLSVQHRSVAEPAYGTYSTSA